MICEKCNFEMKYLEEHGLYHCPKCFDLVEPPNKIKLVVDSFSFRDHGQDSEPGLVICHNFNLKGGYCYACLSNNECPQSVVEKSPHKNRDKKEYYRDRLNALFAEAERDGIRINSYIRAEISNYQDSGIAIRDVDNTEFVSEMVLISLKGTGRVK